MDNRKSHIALENMVRSIPNFERKAQTPNPPQGPVKLGKKRKILEHSELHLPKAIEAGVRAHEYIETKSESPWKSFRKVFELKINDFITFATQNAVLCKIVVVKTFKTLNKLNMLQQI